MRYTKESSRFQYASKLLTPAAAEMFIYSLHNQYQVTKMPRRDDFHGEKN